MAKDGEIRLAGGGPTFSLDDFPAEIRAQIQTALDEPLSPEDMIRTPPRVNRRMIAMANRLANLEAARLGGTLPPPPAPEREPSLAGAAGWVCGWLVVFLRRPAGRLVAALAGLFGVAAAVGFAAVAPGGGYWWIPWAALAAGLLVALRLPRGLVRWAGIGAWVWLLVDVLHH